MDARACSGGGRLERHSARGQGVVSIGVPPGDVRLATTGQCLGGAIPAIFGDTPASSRGVYLLLGDKNSGAEILALDERLHGLGIDIGALPQQRLRWNLVDDEA